MLARVEGLSSVQMLYSAHTRQVITALQDGYMMWTQHSVERKIFDTLVMESGRFGVIITGSFLTEHFIF